MTISVTSPSIQYATAQKLVAVPAYQQQYKVSPTAGTTYTNAYVQPTAISPIKVNTFEFYNFRYIDLWLSFHSTQTT